MDHDRMSAHKAPVLEHPRKSTVTDDCTAQMYVSDRAAFHCQSHQQIQELASRDSDAKTLGRNRVVMHVLDQRVSVEATILTLAAT